MFVSARMSIPFSTVQVPVILTAVDAFPAKGGIGKWRNVFRNEVGDFVENLVELFGRQRKRRLRRSASAGRNNLKDCYPHKRIHRDALGLRLRYEGGLLFRCEWHWNCEHSILAPYVDLTTRAS